MLLEITGVLNEAQLVKVNEILAGSEFVDGKLSAGMAARQVKENEELKKEPRSMELLIRILMSSLAHNQTFNSAVLPYRMSDPIFARYQTGMRYGEHVDDAIMGRSGPRLRSDVSMTLFLRDPESYQGGELLIRTPFGTNQVKLAAGDAVIYPSSSLHRVAEVTAGERMVALFWIQSHVRDPARRELLFELNQARESLLSAAPDDLSTRLVDRSFSNLVRMWSDV
ncbi:MAG: Fe2+-dependent dioxygenase [Gammaproteobacteria bacterium]|nr:Fe2+-dependent dioxygenase [Gammaproteobacteria bacterium]MCP5409896.1 Fe2+-dependent dioxygenase [Chromatiaceae bacterium]MCP5443178.1 Fe2+-dependent dioxygenase [Chromatiaceae bacterium]